MKKIRSMQNWNIYEVTPRDAAKGIPMDYKYLLISKEEAEFSEAMREIEWAADNIQELLDFINPGFTSREDRERRGYTI